MRSGILRAFSLAVVGAAGLSCAGQPDDPQSAPVQPSRSTYEEHAIAAGGVVTSVGADGVPRFIWAGDAQPAVRGRTTDEAAREHVARFAAAYGIASASVGAMRVEPIRRTERGDHLIRLVQELDGIEIYRGELKVVLRPDLSLVALSGTPSRLTSAKPADRSFRLTPGQAVSRALADLYKISVPDGFDSLVRSAEGRDAWVDLPAMAQVQLTEPARSRKVFYPEGDRLVAAYMTEFYASRDRSTSSEAFRYLIAAADGRVLERRDLTMYEAFNYRVYARSAGNHMPTDGPQEDYNPNPDGAPVGADPAFVDALLVSMESFKTTPSGVVDPWLAADAVRTQGNNADAYADLFEPDGFSLGDRRATTTDLRTFDFTYDQTMEPNATASQQKAAVTNLFYVVNWMHDYWYDSGFDEAAGNAQQRNFGRGGVQGDRLLAEAQDYGGLNNANMSTPADGLSPRMQMYGWGGPETRSLEIDPGNLMLVTGYATFGAAEFDLTDDVVLANDGTGTTSDACEMPSNVSGMIALVDRGTCAFTVKAANAQAAGAVGVIVANNAAGQPPPNLGGTDASITIPVLAITFEDGNTIKTMLGSGPVSARMLRDVGVGRSGAIDNMVVAHEWGHYLHHRLSECGSFQCAALSEGWADFNALHNSLQGGDDLNGSFAVGIYAPRLVGDTAYFGIRRFPYSVDPSKNALSFRHIQNAEALPATPIQPNVSPNSEAHNAGEVWASMLWEAYIALQRNPNGRSFSRIKRVFANYVVLGLQLAPIDATFTETRDAILAAVQLTEPGDLQVIANAFAVRGAGSCAIGPPATASGDLTPVTESFETRPSVDIVSVAVDDAVRTCDADGILDGGETGRVTVRVTNKGPTPMTDTTVTLSSTTPGVTFPAGNSVTIASVAPYAVKTVRIRIRLASSVTTTTELDLTATADNAAACFPSVEETLTTLVHLDEVANASATETVEVRDPPWDESGTLSGVWTRVAETVSDHAFHGADSGTSGDVSLISPPLQVSGTGIFTISFDHAYSFEFSPGTPATYWDGGVIEITTDGGATWQDISVYDDPGYDGVITDTSGNPLAGRSAFGSTNPSYPATDPVTLNLGPGLAGQTVQIRFRIGTDAAAGAPGWTIDDIAFNGIDNTPFGVVVNDDGVCTP